MSNAVLLHHFEHTWYSISFDIIVNLLCVSNAALLHHFLKLSTTSFIRHKSDSERRGEDMESGAWEQGAGSGLHRSWGKGANLSSGDQCSFV